MLFNEIYSSYFNTAAEIIKVAVCGNLSEEDINRIILDKAFGESIINIPALIKNGEWRLLSDDLKTPIKNEPSMPLTMLQKRWLKALLEDPKIKLFNPSIDGLEDIEPLYHQKSIVYFDRYSDGDDFENPDYINNFRTILYALKHNKRLMMKYTGKQWKNKEFICSPSKLEYSSKDDKFRLKAVAYKKMFTLNLSKITDCHITDFDINDDLDGYEAEKSMLVLNLTDERNALERVMLNFSHLEKDAVKIDDMHYQITLKYDKSDETEILIRILSFGPMIKVVSPDSFIRQLKSRIDKQQICGV